MKKFYVYCIIIMFGLLGLTHAQLPYIFTQTARNTDSGDAHSVAMGVDGTVFLANYEDGLRAYGYDGSSFINTAHVYDGGDSSRAMGMAVGVDGTVFLANNQDGLRAYSYDGSYFTNTAHINDGGYARDVAVGSDGTVFLANGMDGLLAYSYDGMSFTNTAHIDFTGEAGGFANGVAVGSDGTVFLANGWPGLLAFSYDGSSFTDTAGIGISGFYGSACGVTVASDGTVFLADGQGGLQAYSYDGSSFTNTAHARDVWPFGVAVGSDGTVFTAGRGGLCANSYDGASFTTTAHINDPGIDSLGIASGVTVGPDGTIFLANGVDGLIAYTYSPSVGTHDDLSFIPDEYILQQNYPNPFNPSTTISYDLPEQSSVNLTVYNIRGEEIMTLQNTDKSPGNYEVPWNGLDRAGNQVSTGMYFCRLQAGEYNQTIKMVYLR